MSTLTGYKNRVRDYAAARGHHISECVVKGIAKSLHARQARMSDEDLERVFMHADPTPPRAFRNIADQGGGAARRLGLA